MNWSTLLNEDRARKQSMVDKTQNDNRSLFKKDFDTVCNCTGLRRLQDKAQVFPLEKEDYARTRLTHSIEVMSIAESLGVSAIDVIYEIENKNLSENLKEKIRNIPIILRTAALLHDMGNPPFGHLGEGIISEWFKENLTRIGFNRMEKVIFSEKLENDDIFKNILSKEHLADFENFEGNAQLLRLISKLSFVTDENGMNLSYPVLATVIKYPCSSIEYSDPHKIKSLFNKKSGYFCSEKSLFENIKKSLEIQKGRYPLTFLLEAADDIAYLTADLEDAQKKGIISLSKIEEYFNNEKYNKDKLVLEVRESILKYKKEGSQLEFFDLDNYVIQRLRIFIKGNMISKVKQSFKENYNSIMAGEYSSELLNDSEAKEVASIIREIEKNHIYYCKEIVQSKIESYKIISCLLENFILSVFNVENNGHKDSRDSLIYNLISINYRHICEKSIKNYPKKSDEYIYYKLLLVTDMISGMTDSYALAIYKLLTANK